MTVINTNVKSLVAANALAINNRALSTSMQQLSTGKRINSASDDAAGLAIASKMTSQIKGLDQAVRNGNDGISMLQTAEGAMVEMTNMLQRMRELSVQSANDTNTSSDRTNLNNEYQALKTEITRIGANTQWNGMNILNGNNDLGTVSGNNQTVKFQVGANASQTINIDFKDFTYTTTATSATAATAQINLGGMGAAADMDIFQVSAKNAAGTVVAMQFAVTKPGGVDPTSAEATALAGQMQAGIRTYAGFENVTVTAADEVITFSNPVGGVFSAMSFTKSDAAVATTTGMLTSYGSSGLGTNTPPAGGVFSGTADISASSLTTLALSNTATGAIDSALTAINGERSTIGATINRLTYAVDNLTNVSQNTSASRSRVEDTDYAKATTELARTQIIQQAATAMLAQANQSQQSVLALLK
jgi:flagellin